MANSWNGSTTGTWGSSGNGGACPKARKWATHIATAILGLTTTALMSGGLHYDGMIQETPHLVGGTRIAAAAIGWSATSTALLPGIEAAAKWPGKRTTGAMAAAGLTASLGTALTAVAAYVEAHFTVEVVEAELNHHMANYRASPEIAEEIDTLQRMYACCGSEGPNTYDRSKDHITGEVPESCCANDREDCDRLDGDQLNQEGCARHLGEDLASALQVLTGLLVAQTAALTSATVISALASIGRCNPAEY